MDSNSSSMLHDNLPLDIILIDADSKDPSSSISAPPPEFVTEETLECMYELMSERSMVVINVVARIDSLFYEIGETMRRVFVKDSNNGCVYMVKANDETINRTLIAVKGPKDTSTSRGKILDAWLKSVGLVHDPLELSETIDMFEEVKKMERMDEMD